MVNYKYTRCLDSLAMVLQCKCGGMLEITEQSYPENGLAFEQYECVSCGRTGTFKFGEQNGTHVERMGGCVTSDRGHL